MKLAMKNGPVHTIVIADPGTQGFMSDFLGGMGGVFVFLCVQGRCTCVGMHIEDRGQPWLLLIWCCLPCLQDEACSN